MYIVPNNSIIKGLKIIVYGKLIINSIFTSGIIGQNNVNIDMIKKMT